MTHTPNRAEAERLLGVAEKLLQSRDFSGCRDFAILAQETEPLLDGSDQILAVADVLSSAENRINNHHNWYAVLQIEPLSDDPDLLMKQYRRLALLLHPDKNKFSFADQAFQLVADALAVLSDSAKKSLYDKELSLFSGVDLASSGKLPVRRSQRPAGKNANSTEPVQTGDSNRRTRQSSFWTACPYCYVLYEYPRVYQEYCLRCQNCNRAFHAASVLNLPPLVPGQEAYYCCWGFFPLGFVSGDEENGRKNETAGFPNWMPPIFSPGQQTGGDSVAGAATPPPQPPPTVWAQQQQTGEKTPNVNSGSRSRAPNIPTSTVMGLMAMGSGGGGSSGVARGGGLVQVQGIGGKKRGRPRKNPM